MTFTKSDLGYWVRMKSFGFGWVTAMPSSAFGWRLDKYAVNCGRGVQYTLNRFVLEIRK